jgi:serine/threonine protein kinase
LEHPNIVQIIGVIQEPEITLVMEFVQHGSLQSYLKIHQETLTQAQLLKFALDVAKVCVVFVVKFENLNMINFFIAGHGLLGQQKHCAQRLGS